MQKPKTGGQASPSSANDARGSNLELSLNLNSVEAQAPADASSPGQDEERRASGAAASTSAPAGPFQGRGNLSGGGWSPQNSRRESGKNSRVLPDQHMTASGSEAGSGVLPSGNGVASAAGGPTKSGGPPQGTQRGKLRRNFRSGLRQGMHVLSDFWTHVGSPTEGHTPLKQSGTAAQPQSGKLSNEVQWRSIGNSSMQGEAGASHAGNRATEQKQACSTAGAKQPRLEVLATGKNPQLLAGAANTGSLPGEELGGNDAASGHVAKGASVTNAHHAGHEGGTPSQGGDESERVDDGKAGEWQSGMSSQLDIPEGSASDSGLVKSRETDGGSEGAPQNPGHSEIGGTGVHDEAGNPSEKPGSGTGNATRAARRPHRVLYLRGWPPDDLLDVAGPRSPFLIKLRDFAVSHSLPWPLDGPFRGAQGTANRVHDGSSPASAHTVPQVLPPSGEAPAAGSESTLPDTPTRQEVSQVAANVGNAFQFALDEPELATPLLQGRPSEDVLGGQGARGKTRGVGFGFQGSLVVPGGSGVDGRAAQPIAHRAKSLWERALVLRRTPRAGTLENVPGARPGVVAKKTTRETSDEPGIELVPSAPQRPNDSGTDEALPEEVQTTAHLTGPPDSVGADDSRNAAPGLEITLQASMEQGGPAEASPAGLTDEAHGQEASAVQPLELSGNTGDAAVIADQTQPSPSGDSSDFGPAVESDGKERAGSGAAGTETSANAAGTGSHKEDLETAVGAKREEEPAAMARRDSNLRAISPIYPDPAVMYDHSAVAPAVEAAQNSIDSKAAGTDGVVVEKEDRPSVKTSKLKRSHSSPSIKARYGEAEQAAVEPRYKPAPVEQVARAFPCVLLPVVGCGWPMWGKNPLVDPVQNE